MIKQLDISLLKDIYFNQMIKDFPEDELKTYDMIEEAIRSDHSIALGYYENDSLKGYATVIYAGNNILLDYFAIIKNYRGSGYGTRFLLELKTYFRDYGFLLIESEYNESETAKKRIEFYKHCGCKDSMLRGRLYFVEYAFLYLELSTGYSQEKIKEEIYKIYETVYPDYLGTELLVFY
ncbi:MAG: GNAT family N-acetyltransferase [Solobacterium sp.]|nr:GNAT family N-acetyltransferase [Solobacterium sp.]